MDEQHDHFRGAPPSADEVRLNLRETTTGEIVSLWETRARGLRLPLVVGLDETDALHWVVAIPRDGRTPPRETARLVDVFPADDWEWRALDPVAWTAVPWGDLPGRAAEAARLLVKLRSQPVGALDIELLPL